MGLSARRVRRKPYHTVRLRVTSSAVGLGLLALVAVVLLAYRELYHDRIFPGVEVDGVPVGGMARSEAQAAIAGHLDVALEPPLVVEASQQRWELPRQTLGAHYDVQSLANAAFAIGRTGGAVEALWTPLVTRLDPRDLDATVQVASADGAAALAPISQAINRPAVDAGLVVSADHSVRISPERAGARLDVPEAQREIAAALVAGTAAPVQLTVLEVTPTVRAADLVDAKKQAERMLSAPVSVSYAGHTWELTVDQIQAALVLPGRGAGQQPSSVGVSAQALGEFVARIATAVDRPAHSAQITVRGGQIALSSSRTARAVDRLATEKALRAALLSSNRVVSPVVLESAPPVTESDLATGLKLAQTVVGSPVVVSGPGGQTWTLEPATLTKLLALPTDPLAQRDQPPRLDPAKLKTYVAGLAKQIDRPASNARFHDSGGQISVLRASVAGQLLDQPGAIAAIQQAAVSADGRTVVMPVSTIAPSFGSQDAARLNGIQLIAQNSTSYVGSIPPRRHNVELATSTLNGVVVPPGQIFSFNKELGPQTLDRGFQVGYGIIAEGNGVVKTVPSVGGGICQVSTTLFQPVFWSGYEIEERHWHAYWIAHYASHGYPGLDDTVDDTSGLDFQFKNTTANPLLIQSSTDGSHVTFSIYGVPPTWKVSVAKPVVTNVVKTDRTLQVESDSTLAPGERVYTEAAEDGFTVTVKRTVDEGNGVVRDLTLRSVYAPSHNVIAVGPSA
ncbi:MAG TPA: VanW family protein [Chloroflexota bacterium]|nr:VanW family protein [Chloroflexota bacterium]